MSVIRVTNETFEQEVLGSSRTVLLDFWADWCGPCRMVAPVLEQLAAERQDVKVCKVNVDEAPELAQRYRIMTVPTLMVIKKGIVVRQSSGVKTKGQLLEMLT